MVYNYTIEYFLRIKLMRKINTIVSSILLFLLFLPFSSCKNKSNEMTFPIFGSYEFMGTVSNEGEMYIGFCKKNFNPNVKFFTTDGILKDSIPLQKAQNLLNEITDIWAYTMDSIAVYSNYNGILVVVDKSGNPIFNHSYYTQRDSNGYNYDILPFHPFYPYLQNQRKDVIFSTWMWSGSQEKTPQQLLEDVRKGNLCCKINPFGKEDSVRFGFKYSDIIELKDKNMEDVFFAPFYKVFIVNNRLIMINNYSRYAYFLADNLQPYGTIKVLEETDDILHPIPLNEKGSIQDKANETVKNRDANNYIANILWNKEDKKYIFIVKDGIILNGNTNNFKFKIIEYDESFKKVKVIDINEENLLPVKSFIHSGYLYVETISKDTHSKVFKKIKL